MGFRTTIWRVYWTYVRYKRLANILAGSISRLPLPVDHCCQCILSQCPAVYFVPDNSSSNPIFSLVFSRFVFQQLFTTLFFPFLRQDSRSQPIIYHFYLILVHVHCFFFFFFFFFALWRALLRRRRNPSFFLLVCMCGRIGQSDNGCCWMSMLMLALMWGAWRARSTKGRRPLSDVRT